MVDRVAPSASALRLAASDPSHDRPESVSVLEELLRTLFPEPPSLDCITIDDIQRRYPLTGLGAPALAAIEQSQRLIRARGDYTQMGLSEFHVGLIYLNWEDYRAAANQFALARQPWMMIGDEPVMCLAHFAQGLALYHAFHNEAAMLHFGRAERMLKRAPLGAQNARQSALEAKLRPLLTVAQETLRVSLWPEDRPEEGASRYLSVPPRSGGPAGREEQAAYARAPHEPVGGARERLAFARARPSQARVPLPISNLPGGMGDLVRGPVPGHVTVDDRFGWYIIAERTSDFLPSLVAGSWLLADREADERPGRDYVIVGSRLARLGAIVIQPVSHSSAVPYCYLGYRENGAGESRLFLDETNRPAAPESAVVLAVVEGIWHGLEGSAAWPELGA